MKRKIIMTAVGDRMKQISIANGYNSEIGLNTFYWHDPPLEYGYPALVYRDVGEEHEHVGRMHEQTLHVEVEGLLFTDNPGAEASNMIADIIRAIGVDPTWGGLAYNLHLIKNSTITETDGRTAVRVIVEFDVMYRVPLFQP